MPIPTSTAARWGHKMSRMLCVLALFFCYTSVRQSLCLLCPWHLMSVRSDCRTAFLGLYAFFFLLLLFTCTPRRLRSGSHFRKAAVRVKARFASSRVPFIYLGTGINSVFPLKNERCLRLLFEIWRCSNTIFHTLTSLSDWS